MRVMPERPCRVLNSPPESIYQAASVLECQKTHCMLVLEQALQVAQSSLTEAGQVIGNLSSRNNRSQLTNEVLSKLNNIYNQVQRTAGIMQSVKVTKRGPPGCSLTPASAKQMLEQAHSELKELHDCINLGKALR